MIDRLMGIMMPSHGSECCLSVGATVDSVVDARVVPVPAPGFTAAAFLRGCDALNNREFHPMLETGEGCRSEVDAC